jgi:hypothetical protein
MASASDLRVLAKAAAEKLILVTADSSLGSALGNGFGAEFSFGGIAFFIGVIVRKLVARLSSKDTCAVLDV